MGDAGTISSQSGLVADVEDTAKPPGRPHAHRAKIGAGSVDVGDTVHLSVDVNRRDRIRANHSATHLLHAAPRNRLRSEEHTSELQSLMRTSYAVFCLKKKKTDNN